MQHPGKLLVCRGVLFMGEMSLLTFAVEAVCVWKGRSYQKRKVAFLQATLH